MFNVLWSIVADIAWERMGSFALILALIGVGIWQWRKYGKSRKVFAAAEELLSDANRVVHHMLNANSSKPDDQVAREFEIWESETEAKLQKLRRQKICHGWHVDHFQVLVRAPLVS